MKMIKWLFSLFSKRVVIQPILEGSTITLSRADFIIKLKEYGIDPISLATPLDSIVRLASKAELDKIAPSLAYPGEWYTADLWDCEDFGLQAQLDAGRKFEITVRLGLGMANNNQIPNPPIYHGFAITLDTEYNVWLLEPNSGFSYSGKWFKPGEHGYNLTRY